MSRIDENVLRDVLLAQSQQAAVPYAPVDHLLDAGHVSVRRRRRRLAAGAAAAAAVIAVVAGVALQPSHPRSHGPVAPTPSGAPRTLADLPRGEVPRLPFAEDDTLYVNGGATNLDGGDPVLSTGGEGGVVFWAAQRDDAPSSLQLVDPETGELGKPIAYSTSRPVVSADGSLVAWEDDNPDGTARVRLWDLDSGSMLDPISFPFTPSCCDKPFRLNGIDAEGNVYATGVGTVWVAPARGGAEPRIVSGIDGKGDVVMEEVDRTRLVVTEGATWVGHLDGARFVRDFQVLGSLPTLSWDETRIAYVDETGRADSAHWQAHVWVAEVESGRAREMGLPDDVNSVDSLLWESSTDVLIQVTTEDATVEHYAWVRCAIDTGRCEIATEFDTQMPSLPLR